MLVMSPPLPAPAIAVKGAPLGIGLGVGLGTTYGPSMPSSITVLHDTPFTATAPLVTKMPINTAYGVGVPGIYAKFDVDTGLNENYQAQRQVTEYIMYRTLDKWIPHEIPSILKYLIFDINTKRIVPIASIKEYETNKLSEDTTEIVRAKIDFIQENILSMEKTRRLLIRVVHETPYKFYELPHRENFMINVMKKFLKKKLKQMIPDANVEHVNYERTRDE